MRLKEKIQKLGAEENNPCVTVTLNTHRTHPDNTKDTILLKNLLKEAEERVISEFGKRPVSSLLEKINTVSDDIDVNYNLDSLHIFLSNDTQEIIRTALPANEDAVHISTSFALRPLIKDYSRTKNYLIMLLSQGGVHLYEAVNDGISDEIKDEHFPFSENRYYNTHSDKGSDPKHLDDLVREFFNKVDKALVKIYNETGLHCLVVCTEDNYSRLQQVADLPNIYLGYAAINYNDTSEDYIAKQSWDIVKEIEQQKRTEIIGQMQETVSQGKVLVDLQEIYQAAIDGRGEVLIVHQSFSQAVIMQDDRTFELTEDSTEPNAIDDITGHIAWEVISKNGEVVFTEQEEIKTLGEIVLKTRY